MSSLMVIQEHDRLTFAVDTARCVGDKDGKLHRVYNEKVQKVHMAGNDMVFIAGMTECTEDVENNLHRFVKDRHINPELLTQFLRKRYPLDKCRWIDIGLRDVGVTVLSVVNGCSLLNSFKQDDNYKQPIIGKTKAGAISLWVDGFDNGRLHRKAQQYLSTCNGNYTNPETFRNIYQKNYSEGVGGFIQVYSINSFGCELLKEYELEERNLRYAYYE